MGSRDIVWVVHCKLGNNLGDQILGKGFAEALVRLGVLPKRVEYIGMKNSLFLRVLNKIGLRYIASVLGVLRYLPAVIRDKPKAITIGGGQLLLPHSNFIGSLWGWAIMSRILRIKFVVFSVGGEEGVMKYSRIKKILLKHALEHASAVMLRDYCSQVLIKKLCGRTYRVVPDVAYGLDLSEIKFSGKSDVYVCPAAMHSVSKYAIFSTQDEYYHAFLDKISKELRPDEQVILFSTTVEDYLEMPLFLRFIENSLPNASVKILPFPGEDNLLHQLSSARVVVGSRMHALIFAHLLGAKVLSVNRNQKIEDFEINTLNRSPGEVARDLHSGVETILKVIGIEPRRPGGSLNFSGST